MSPDIKSRVRDLANACSSPEDMVQALNELVQCIHDDAQAQGPESDDRPWNDITKRLSRNFAAWSFPYHGGGNYRA